MKKLVILLISSVSLLFSCKNKESDLIGGNATVSGRLTQSCEDSTPVKYQVLKVTDDFNFGISFITDSNGYFNYTVPASSNTAYIRGNSGDVLLGGYFCIKSQDIGTIYLNPCVKAIVHYDTVGHKKKYDRSFVVKFDKPIQKDNLKSLLKPDTVLFSRYNLYSIPSYPLKVFFQFDGITGYEYTANSNELLVPSYTYNHYTVKVP